MTEHRFKKYIHSDTWGIWVDPDSENELIELTYKNWTHKLSSSLMHMLMRSTDGELIVPGNCISCPCFYEDTVKYTIFYGLTAENNVLVCVHDHEENRMENAAKAAYDAYAQAVGGKTFDDKPMLHWESLPERIRSGWVAAAAAARIVAILIED